MRLTLEKETATTSYTHAESGATFELAPTSAAEYLGITKKCMTNGQIDPLMRAKIMSRRIKSWSLDYEITTENREKFAEKFVMTIMPGLIDASVDAGAVFSDAVDEAKKD